MPYPIEHYYCYISMNVIYYTHISVYYNVNIEAMNENDVKSYQFKTSDDLYIISCLNSWKFWISISQCITAVIYRV